MNKKYLETTVFEEAKKRIEYIFNEFKNVLVAFSCGKDSGVLLNLAYEHAKTHDALNKMAMLYMDYEAEYESTERYADRSFNHNFDGIKKYWLCLPISAQCSCSMTEPYWIPWDKDKKDIWVKDMPKNKHVINEDNCPFDFKKGTYGQKTRENFEKWFGETYGKTAVLIGLRCDESLNRLAVITSKKRKNMHDGIRYSKKMDSNVTNFYPLYDWKAEDIWVANAKFGWDYNEAYDLMYMAGASPATMRIASPFHSCGQDTLKLYKALSPNTWGMMVNRVNGVNFMGTYGGTEVTGHKEITKPQHFTWKDYCRFLMNTLDGKMKTRYEKTLKACLDKNNELSEESIYKQMCACVIKNDHSCRLMKLGVMKEREEKRKGLKKKYVKIAEGVI